MTDDVGKAAFSPLLNRRLNGILFWVEDYLMIQKLGTEGACAPHLIAEVIGHRLKSVFAFGLNKKII
jgi:hypothetical protein